MAAEGVDVDPGDMIVTTGGQQVIDLVCKTLLDPGDVVVAELSIEKVRNRGQLDMITVLVDLAVDGATVCEARSTLMHTREDDHA